MKIFGDSVANELFVGEKMYGYASLYKPTFKIVSETSNVDTITYDDFIHPPRLG